MDNFGVLVQNYGIKPQGKSAPMSSSKKPINFNPSSNSKIESFFNNNNNINNNYDDDIFGLNSGKKSDVFDDVFKTPTKSNHGVDVNIENMFMGSVSLNPNPNPVDGVNDDVIWGFNGSTSGGGGVGNNGSKDLLSSDPVDDFLGSLGNLGSGRKFGDLKGGGVGNDFLGSLGSGRKDGDLKGGGVGDDFLGNLGSGPGQKHGDLKGGGGGVDDDLLGGFGRSFTTNGRAQASSTQTSAATSYLDELEEFASSKLKKNATVNFDASRIRNELNKTSKLKSHETNFFDIDGNSHVNSVPRSGMERESEVVFQTDAADLDSFFSAHSRTNKPVSKDKPLSNDKPASKDKPVSKDKPINRKTVEVPDLFFGNTSNVNKTPSSSFGDDFSSIFGDSPSVGRFEEVEGESEERRKARFERYRRTEARMVEALANMNQREYKAQQEQEDRHRIAEAMDMEMKRWVAGKEGNLRALLSSLQQVLGPEFGWRPVNLTDLITSSQVKIAYKKAALCVHPDKVQQRGASLQQKYVAEKVFDLLKEAQNKFNSEELR